MPDFTVTLEWDEAKQGRLAAGENPPLPVASPPVFGGPSGVWSAEDLFVGSLAACLMSTFLYFVERLDVPLAAYTSRATGRMEKTPNGLRFTSMDVTIEATVADEAARRRAADLRFKEKLEAYCPVSTALACPVRITVNLSAGAESAAE